MFPWLLITLSPPSILFTTCHFVKLELKLKKNRCLPLDKVENSLVRGRGAGLSLESMHKGVTFDI